ncbi:MAG: thiamine pyrophosphate-dependent enzyme [Oscillospiraceae bacterium]
MLSKGHAGPVAYATFGLMGYYPMEDAYTLNQPHTRFPSHTDRKLTPGVDLTTGSLGQGVSTATGAALANRIDGRDNHVFCVIGDGEVDEGQVWEAFHFAFATSWTISFISSTTTAISWTALPGISWITAISRKRRSPSGCTRSRSTAMM